MKLFLQPRPVLSQNGGGSAMEFKAEIFDEKAIARTIKRISHEILEKNESTDGLCLVGIKTRGVPLAKRIAECIYSIERKNIPSGMIDITFYRDDLTHISGEEPNVGQAALPFNVEGKNVILVDDVIYTGRTVRAAMEALIKNGRPSKIQLAVLVDRGHRELPIRPDYVGKNIPTSKGEIVRVALFETDGTDGVELYKR